MVNEAGVIHTSNLRGIKCARRDESQPIINFFWVLFGVLAFMPLEITEGLFVGYFQVIILFILSNRISKIRLLLYLFFSSVVIFSTVLGDDARLTSLVNPLVIGLAFMSNIRSENRSTMIKKGIYISAAANSFFLLYLLSQANISTLYAVLTSRTWAVESMPWFGNGLAMSFSMAMLLASKDGKNKLLLLLFIGGILTTSRMPILSMAVILLVYVGKNIKFNHLWKVVIIGILISLAYMVIVNDTDLADQADGIVSRVAYAADRNHVYTLTLSKIAENPMFGAGSENLEYFGHAHNSYLQIAYRYGFFALASWLLLVYLAFFRNLILFKHIDFILIFGLVSFFQIGLLNSNLVMLLILYCRFFSDKKLEHAHNSYL